MVANRSDSTTAAGSVESGGVTGVAAASEAEFAASSAQVRIAVDANMPIDESSSNRRRPARSIR